MFNSHQQRGTGLMEVMVSALVLAIGLLGVMALQAKSLQFSQQSYLFNQATLYAHDISERIRVNSDTADSYLIDFGESSSASGSDQCLTGVCTPAQLAQWDLKIWLDNVEAGLPNGEASISRIGDQIVITIRFDSTRGEEDLQSVSFTMQV